MLQLLPPAAKEFGKNKDRNGNEIDFRSSTSHPDNQVKVNQGGWRVNPCLRNLSQNWFRNFFPDRCWLVHLGKWIAVDSEKNSKYKNSGEDSLEAISCNLWRCQEVTSLHSYSLKPEAGRVLQSRKASHLLRHSIRNCGARLRRKRFATKGTKL